MPAKIFACLLLLFSLTACGDSSAPGQPPEAGTPAQPASGDAEREAPDNPVAPAPAEERRQELYLFEEPWTGDLDAMEERRVIRMLTVYGVGRYYLDGAQEKGLVKEAARLLEKFVNQRLKRRNILVQVVVIPVARDRLIPALLEGRGDIVVASLSITPEREEIVDFTIPSSKPLSEILVTGPAAPALDSIDGLSGQTVYVRHSSSYRESLEALNRRFEQAGMAPVVIAPASELLEDDDLVEMVNSGMLPWAVVDDYKMVLWKDAFENLVPREDIVFREGGRIAWAIRKQSPGLQQLLDDFLRKNREGTLIGNTLKNRWLRDFDWAGNALAQEDFERFNNLRPLFEKYGDMYGIDPLLVAAQGYQESKLDQRARSAAGAIGVMQMLPATARDTNVGIPDIHTADANIHAGVKYLDFLRDRYFDTLDDDDINKTLLALATYNVGPRRMINLRNRAGKLGYNPDVWFGNVEVVAAKQVGGEPVRYVANIYKYYLSYRLSQHQVLLHREARERVGIE